MRRLLAYACFMPLLASCSGLAGLISNLQDECSDFSANETDIELNEQCRALEDFLASNTDNLATLTEVLGQAEADGLYTISLLLTDSSGESLEDLDASDVTAAVSTDGGASFTSIDVEDVDRYADLAESEAGVNHLSLSTIMDYSASILDDDLDFVAEGLGFLFENLSDFYRGELVRFSTDVEVAEPFTDNIASLLAASQEENFERRATSLYDGLMQGLEDLAAEDSSLKIALLFTDGIDNDSEATYDEVKTLFQNEGIPVCVIGVSFADVGLLEDIADDSGCFFVYRTLFDHLEGAFSTVVDRLEGLQRVRVDADDLAGADLLRLTLGTSDGVRTVNLEL